MCCQDLITLPKVHHCHVNSLSTSEELAWLLWERGDPADFVKRFLSCGLVPAGLVLPARHPPQSCGMQTLCPLCYPVVTSICYMLRLSEKHQPGLHYSTPRQLARPSLTSSTALSHAKVLLFSMYVCVQYEHEGLCACVCVSQRNSGPLALPLYTHSHYGWLPGNCTCCFYLTSGPVAASADWENAHLFLQLQEKLPLTLCSISTWAAAELNNSCLNLIIISHCWLCYVFDSRITLKVLGGYHIGLRLHRKQKNLWLWLDFPHASAWLLSICLHPNTQLTKSKTLAQRVGKWKSETV